VRLCRDVAVAVLAALALAFVAGDSRVFALDVDRAGLGIERVIGLGAHLPQVAV